MQIIFNQNVTESEQISRTSVEFRVKNVGLERQIPFSFSNGALYTFSLFITRVKESKNFAEYFMRTMNILYINSSAEFMWNIFLGCLPKEKVNTNSNLDTWSESKIVYTYCWGMSSFCVKFLNFTSLNIATGADPTRTCVWKGEMKTFYLVVVGMKITPLSGKTEQRKKNFQWHMPSYLILYLILIKSKMLVILCESVWQSFLHSTWGTNTVFKISLSKEFGSWDLSLLNWKMYLIGSFQWSVLSWKKISDKFWNHNILICICTWLIPLSTLINPPSNQLLCRCWNWFLWENNCVAKCCYKVLVYYQVLFFFCLQVEIFHIFFFIWLIYIIYSVTSECDILLFLRRGIKSKIQNLIYLHKKWEGGNNWEIQAVVFKIMNVHNSTIFYSQCETHWFAKQIEKQVALSTNESNK